MSTRIMIIDNEKNAYGFSHSFVLSEELKRNFCQTACFDAAKPALDAYPDFQPHLIFCEERLADKYAGWDVAYSILSPLNYTVKPCYFVALLANQPNRRNTAIFKEFGFDEVVCKFQPDGTSMTAFTLMGFVTKARVRAEEYNNRYNKA